MRKEKYYTIQQVHEIFNASNVKKYFYNQFKNQKK